MCNSYNFIEQYGSNSDIVPSEFNLVHTSDILSNDNKFEVYENGKIGAINYRGATANMFCWVENCYSAMIQAKRIIKINDSFHKYAFSVDQKLAVHTGYALTIAIL
jgi:hypothetical protein